jgi:hypothetical protein
MMIARPALLATMMMCSTACDVIGPSCLNRQKTGSVTTVSGEVAPGTILSHRIPYESSGSQNDGLVSWTRQAAAGGPRLSFYATRLACEDFDPLKIPGSGPCSTLARAGWTPIGVASTLTVTNGRGNPDVLGIPAEYKIWVVGDPEQRAAYTISVTWFFGPDC